MSMTTPETLVIVGMVTLGTIITRGLPFLLFQGKREKNDYIDYLGKVLPYSAMGLLVVYCLKSVNLKLPPHGIPEAISIVFIAIVHNWKGNTLFSIGAGTALYMALVQTVF